jgi:eukaryotic-like serine/threonine-protein kinase
LPCPSCGADASDVSRFCLSCGATLARGDQDEYVGRTLAHKYKVEALIGEGGMGKVYRARQEALDKLVVLKVLRQSLLNDERTVARFKREAKAASRLNHPNSISILDFGQAEDGALFIAMEFVPGQDLHTVLSKEGPLPESRIARIVSQVLSALYDAHSAGVIHRDLKPENIMVEPRRNEPDFVKVLDFGIAKIQDGTNDDGPALTRNGFVCGTPEYMSPEQARGATLDHRSDLYAVGVILYQLVTGRLPFESDSAVGFATKHLTEEPVPPSRRRPEVRVSPAMDRLIMRALSKSPDDRPQDAEVFKAELLAVGDKERERRTVAPPRSRQGLAPLPRKSTLPPEDKTEAWKGLPEPTVRAERRDTSPSGATRAAERTQLAPAPQRDRPSVSMTALRAAPERSTSERLATQVSAPLLPDKTEALILPVSEPEPEGGGIGFFKAFVLSLALATLALVGYWLYSSWQGQSHEQPFEPPKGAPIPGQSTPGPDKKSGAYVPNPGAPLYEREIPERERDQPESQRHVQEAHEAFKRGHLDLAATKFREAFASGPTPELSLMLGEVYWARGDCLDCLKEARGWWLRHLRDMPDSKAREILRRKDPALFASDL